jgi:hypothetical protein
MQNKTASYATTLGPACRRWEGPFSHTRYSDEMRMSIQFPITAGNNRKWIFCPFEQTRVNHWTQSANDSNLRGSIIWRSSLQGSSFPLFRNSMIFTISQEIICPIHIHLFENMKSSTNFRKWSKYMDHPGRCHPWSRITVSPTWSTTFVRRSTNRFSRASKIPMLQDLSPPLLCRRRSFWKQYTAGRRSSAFLPSGVPIDIRCSKIKESLQKWREGDYRLCHGALRLPLCSPYPGNPLHYRECQMPRDSVDVTGEGWAPEDEVYVHKTLSCKFQAGQKIILSMHSVSPSTGDWRLRGRKISGGACRGLPNSLLDSDSERRWIVLADSVSAKENGRSDGNRNR